MKKKLRYHRSAQCYIIEHENGTIDFISYCTRVITITRKKGKRFVECAGTYSATTRRQIGWFLKEYAPDLDYYDMKLIAGKGVKAI